MAFQNVTQIAGWVHPVGLGLGVKLLLARRKQHVAAGRFKALGVGVQRARVAVKVFVRRKLEAVHKNAGHRHVSQWFGLPQQRNMAVVQVTHGGYKGGASKPAEAGAQIRNGMNDVHQVSFKGESVTTRAWH